MSLPPQAQAVMLLTVSLGRSRDPRGRALSVNEWARFAAWLREHDLDPAELLKGDLDDLLCGWVDRTVTAARLRALLHRGAALGLSLEKWRRAGLWVLTRSDPDYPGRLKKRLRAESPPVLFGCGDKALLSRGGIAVVGSRDASEEDLSYTERLGGEAAAQGYSIVSGGARGVDRSAMSGALESEGTAVGVLADSLLKSATSSRYRKPLMSGDLALVTPFNPEAGFNVGNAMARNRYIYCLADAAVVISSTFGKGGTWNGAIEDLDAGWVPLWIKHCTNEHSGNSELVRRGAHRLPEDGSSLSILADGAGRASVRPVSHGLPFPEHVGDRQVDSERENDSGATPRSTQESVAVKTSACPQVTHQPSSQSFEPAQSTPMDFYVNFLAHLRILTLDSPMTAYDIAKRLDLQKAQTHVWLKRAEGDGAVIKLKKPVRYRTAEVQRRQTTLFDEDTQAKK